MAVPHSASPPPTRPAPIRRPRRARLVLISPVALLVLVVAILGGIGWYFSDQLLRVTHAQKPYTLHVTAIGAGATYRAC